MKVKWPQILPASKQKKKLLDLVDLPESNVKVTILIFGAKQWIMDQFSITLSWVTLIFTQIKYQRPHQSRGF
jgi:hypothetical protein